MGKGIYINDSIHGLIALSEYEKRIISSTGFNRLHDVYQNSTVYLTFPSNRTKRFEHSIGTMKLCSDMFYFSILNSDEATIKKFYDRISVECTAIIKMIAKDANICEQKLGGRTPRKSSLPEICFDKFNYSLIPYNVPQNYKTLHIIVIESVRTAALLHDIGHPPFSHIVEDALKSIYYDFRDKNETNEQIKQFLEVMKPYFEGDSELHEQMGKDISQSILKEIIKGLTDEQAMQGDENYDKNLFEIMILKIVRKIYDNEGIFGDLHKIIDGTLDGDRLDYITRDSINSGLNNGKIEYSRIINEMRIFSVEDRFYFCVPLKAQNSVEDFITRRYNIYKDIIFHHRVIKTDYLLGRIVKELVYNYLQLNGEDISAGGSNWESIPFNISGLWYPQVQYTDSETGDALAQWNDSWLMTILRQYYFTLYQSKKPEENSYILKLQMDELLRSRKYYYSLIKRGEQFKVVDDAFLEALSKFGPQIQGECTRINQNSERRENSSKLGDTNGSRVNIDATLRFIDIILAKWNNNNGFALNYVRNHYKAISDAPFYDRITDAVQRGVKSVFTNSTCCDIIVMENHIRIGSDKPVYFYDNNGCLLPLADISGISIILQQDFDYLPAFYVYILAKDGDSVVRERRSGLLREIGREIGDAIGQVIVDLLNSKI